MKSWSKDQSTIATSSGEAELYALNKAASEAMGIQSIATDLGIKTSITLEVDALATMGIISRSGIGKMRHLEVNELWLQEAIKRKKFDIVKVNGADNAADIATKHIPAETLEKHIEELKITFATG